MRDDASTARGLWRHRDFLRLWAAQAISALGSQVTLLALPLAAVVVLDAKPYEVALLSTAATVPNLLGVIAGVWLDRIRRRPVMIAADIGRAGLLASAPIAYAFGILTLPHLYAVALAGGLCSVLFEIASQAYLPSVVARADLIEANAKFEGSRVVASAVGPSAAGALISLVSAPFALLADAASFVASAVLVRSVSRRDEDPQLTAETNVRRGGLREGARYVLADHYLRPLLIAHALANVALGLVWAVFVVYAVRELGLTAALIGVALSLGQIGGFAGAVFGRRVADSLGVGRTIVAAFFLFGPATLLIAAAPREAAVPFLALGWTFENMARALYGVSATSVRQALVPDALQARVVGFTTTAGTGAFPLGTAIGGALASGLGLREAIMVGAAISFLPFIPIAASPIRALRGLPARAA